jgi:hypothetical protein
MTKGSDGKPLPRSPFMKSARCSMPGCSRRATKTLGTQNLCCTKCGKVAGRHTKTCDQRNEGGG